MGTGFSNQFSWSHSRNETFRDCLRRYFYTYYGSWGGWEADADPLVRKLYILKNLKNRYLWAGGIVHEAIAGVLEQIRAGRQAPEMDRTAEEAVQRMRSEFRESRDAAYLEQPKRKVGLAEHHYREAVSDETWRAFAATVRGSIEGFFRGPYLAALREVPPGDWMALENLDSFAVDGVKVYVKMDLAYRRADERLLILDWKTGRRTPQPQSLQLGCYALYAHEAWAIPPERIEVIEVNLNTGTEGRARVTAEHLTTARREITAGIAAMRARLADPQANLAQEQDFPVAPEERRCGRCVYREVCPGYREMQRAGQAAPVGMAGV